jgi:hypothetical protein
MARTRPADRRSPPKADPIATRGAFTCRLRVELQARVDEARFRLRMPSRQATIVRAIEEFLNKHQVA